MIELGVTHFYEIGSGNVLTGLIGRIDKSVTALASDKLLGDRLKSGGRG